MENRPFYELDDDEMLIEEATHAALSDAVRPVATTASITPALPMRSATNRMQASALIERFSRRDTLTLLDHAYLVSNLACTLTADGVDAYGFAATVRAEAATLLLEFGRCGEAPRSNTVEFPVDGVARFIQTHLDYSGTFPPGLSIRLERDALTQFASTFADSAPFFRFRRFTLALMPQLNKDEHLTDALEKYTVSARILVNTAAAKQAILPWGELAMLSDVTTEQHARRVLDALQESLGTLDT